MRDQNIINILLAEDNEDDVVIIRDAFAQRKLVNILHVVDNGQEAMEYLLQRGQYENAVMPGLVILDINMPKKNGLEVLKEIKTNSVLKHLPVIMLTTSTQERDIVQSYSDGACSYVTKPVNFDEFIKVVDQFSLYWALVAKIPEV